MVFVKVRETYDLHTVQNKMTVIGIHTPKPDIIKANFPGLLMQCKAYRPVSADVRIACASVLPLDPLGIGTTEGDVAPEDMFNPILYKAISNIGMSQIEARIQLFNSTTSTIDVRGNTVDVDVDSVSSLADEFPLYYGLLSNAHGWKQANPQAGLEMTNLKPYVHEVLYNFGDQNGPAINGQSTSGFLGAPTGTDSGTTVAPQSIRGNAKPLPFINTASYTSSVVWPGYGVPEDASVSDPHVANSEGVVPWINCLVGCIIIPPSRLHELFYRMVVEWTIEFSQIRPIGEITNWTGLGVLGGMTHYQNYDYSETKKALTGTDESIMTEDTCMVSTTVPIEKVF